jgi:uncharacterized membrane protein
MSTNVLESIDVHVPVRTAYNQWTQFESFPQFMEGVQRIDQIGPTKTTGSRRSPASSGVRRRGSPSSTPTSGSPGPPRTATHQSGVVTFHRIDDGTTRVTLQLDHDPQGFRRRPATRWAS